MNYKKIIPYFLLLLVVGLFLSFYMRRNEGSGTIPQNFPVLSNLNNSNVETQSQHPVCAKINRNEIEDIIADFINKNPKLIMDSVSQYVASKSHGVEQGVDVSGKVEILKDKIFNPQTPKVGAASAKVKIVEFFDYDCKFCRSMLETKLKILANNPDVEIFFKEIPVVGNDDSFASKAVIAAYIADSKQYFQFHQALLNSQGPLTQDAVFGIAKKLGMDTAKLKASMEDPAVLDILNNNAVLSQDLNIEGAPAYIIDDKMYFGTLSYAVMQDLIDKAKSKAQQNAAPAAEGNTTTSGASGSSMPPQQAARTGLAQQKTTEEKQAVPEAAPSDNAKPQPETAKAEVLPQAQAAVPPPSAARPGAQGVDNAAQNATGNVNAN